MRAPTFALAPAEQLLNRVLRLDPEAFAELQNISGKVLALHVVGVGVSLYARFEPEGVALSGEKPAPADVSVSGPPFALLRLLLTNGGDVTRLREDVSVTGDIAVAQQVKVILDRLDIDWEEPVSRVVGDVAAHRIGNVARTLHAWGRDSIRTLLLDAGEYLTEESRLVPARSELEAFSAAVDMLRDDVERIAKRVQKLSQRARTTRADTRHAE